MRTERDELRDIGAKPIPATKPKDGNTKLTRSQRLVKIVEKD